MGIGFASHRFGLCPIVNEDSSQHYDYLLCHTDAMPIRTLLADKEHSRTQQSTPTGIHEVAIAG